VKQPQSLFFFPLALFEITFNCHQGTFSQSQLAALLEMPTTQSLQANQPIVVALAPAGVKNVPLDVDSGQELIGTHNWKQASVGLAPERPEWLLGRILARRKQYGLRHRIASTIHAVMGQDLNALVTKVSATDSRYTLWSRQQVVVLLSRTFRAQELMFHGNPQETASVLFAVLGKRTQYDDFMELFLKSVAFVPGLEMDIASQPSMAFNQVQDNLHPYRACHVEIPFNNGGFAYMLVSIKNPQVTYIGQCKNLYRRFEQHNSGKGGKTTNQTLLRPWGLLSYVAGFQGQLHLQLRFENQWQNRRNLLTSMRAVSVMEQSQLGLSLLREEDWKPWDLIYVQCGQV
jgi:GIY-YIG catalytic domain